MVLIECLRSFSEHGTPPGYRFIKPLRNDMGGLFALLDSCFASSITSIAERQPPPQEDVKVGNLLSIPERDRQFRLVLQWKATTQANFTYLEPRHDGLKEEVDPTGKTYLRRPKAGETPDTIGNCHRAELFVELYAKNLPFEGTDNPVCTSCHLAKACRGSVGAGFGHRRKRFLTFKSQNLLAHLDSILLLSLSGKAISRSLISQSIQAILLEKLGGCIYC